MPVLYKTPPEMSLAEFLAWDAPGPQRWQLIDGAPVAMAPAHQIHGTIHMELGRIISNHLIANALLCRAVIEPGIVPKVKANINFRVPDIAVTCAKADIDKAYVDEPVLLIEILSPANKTETWSNVWTYTTIPSVMEIFVISSHGVFAELLRRNRDGSWPDETIKIETGAVVLESIGFTFDLSDAYRGTGLV
jgi:Uma2 family endonuclease